MHKYKAKVKKNFFSFEIIKKKKMKKKIRIKEYINNLYKFF
jgi:hypothetical protein